MRSQSKNSQEIERLAELGILTTSLLHDISNPISAALLSLEHHKNSPEVAVNKAYGSIKTLSLYVRAARQQISKDENISRFNVNAQLSQIKRVILPHAKYSGVKISFCIKDRYYLFGNPIKFQQLLTNIIVNSIEAYSEVSSTDKPVRVTIYAEQRSLVFEIADHGKGIQASKLSQIFLPYYTTKNDGGKGLGIGLALVEEYVTKDFGGTICVKSSRRLGTVFTLKLPAA